MTQVLTQKNTRIQNFFVKWKARKTKTLQDFQSFLIASGKTHKENISENIDSLLY